VALRSVVLVPPPGAGGPRRTVVVRPGGPKEKGRLADLLAALLGLLLLVLAIVLVVVLPVKEYATPQFRVTFLDSPVESGTQKFDFVEGSANTHEFTYELPDDVASVHILAEFSDNVTASLPDQFRVELFDPAGNPVSVKFDLTNPPPVDPDPSNATQTQTQAVAALAKGDWVVATGAHPQEQIVPGLSHTETREQVLARLVPQFLLKTAGTWTVRVTLVAANDCPTPSPDSTDFQRMAICRSEAPDGNDQGNPFSLANFIYTRYTPCVEALGTRSAAPLCAAQP
jgi:hypothetical protein